MHAIHVIWTAPKNGQVFSTDYELLTAVLSALTWRKTGGRISMYTDNPEYFKNSGFSRVWDEIVPLKTENPPDAKTFWAAGKIYAMREAGPPFCVLDTDFIVWKKPDFGKNRLAAIHEEELSEAVYPDFKEFFSAKPYSKSVKPVNTAFTYINDIEFLKLYTTEAINFMKTYPKTSDTLCPMVFAEQRMFSMCADALDIKINILSDLESLFKNGADGHFTHLWGFKQQMNENNVLRHDYRNKVLERIKKDFPEYYEQLKNILF